MGINQFAYFTQEEFVEIYLGRGVPKSKVIIDESFISVADTNWVTAGAVTPVKNQGSCNAGYAFATTGAL